MHGAGPLGRTSAQSRGHWGELCTRPVRWLQADPNLCTGARGPGTALTCSAWHAGAELLHGAGPLGRTSQQSWAQRGESCTGPGRWCQADPTYARAVPGVQGQFLSRAGKLTRTYARSRAARPHLGDSAKWNQLMHVGKGCRDCSCRRGRDADPNLCTEQGR
jgi:hypothetical protein